MSIDLKINNRFYYIRTNNGSSLSPYHNCIKDHVMNKVLCSFFFISLSRHEQYTIRLDLRLPTPFKRYIRPYRCLY